MIEFTDGLFHQGFPSKSFSPSHSAPPLCLSPLGFSGRLPRSSLCLASRGVVSYSEFGSTSNPPDAAVTASWPRCKGRDRRAAVASRLAEPVKTWSFSIFEGIVGSVANCHTLIQSRRQHFVTINRRVCGKDELQLSSNCIMLH